MRKKSIFYIILLIYLLIGIIIGGLGYSSFLLLFNESVDRYFFLTNLYLIGVFIGATSYLSKNKDSLIFFFGQIILFGSLLSFLFLGLQLIQFYPNFFMGSFLITIFSKFCTFSSSVMFAGTIGLIVEIFKQVVKKLKNPIFKN